VRSAPSFAVVLDAVLLFAIILAIGAILCVLISILPRVALPLCAIATPRATGRGLAIHLENISSIFADAFARIAVASMG